MNAHVIRSISVSTLIARRTFQCTEYLLYINIRSTFWWSLQWGLFTEIKYMGKTEKVSFSSKWIKNFIYYLTCVFFNCQLSSRIIFARQAILYFLSVRYVIIFIEASFIRKKIKKKSLAKQIFPTYKQLHYICQIWQRYYITSYCE